MTRKRCSQCGKKKSLSQFSKDRHKQSGYRAYCKECGKIARTKWGHENVVHLREYDKQYNLLQNYGITLDEYNRMFLEQNGCCAICGRHQSEFTKALFVDHDHVTNKVRALLCSNCNLILGHSRDDPTLLVKVIEYLERNSI